ncbi:MAG: nuclear transport factor 2 family protein [Spongiibacteraceae bacterium]
MENELTQLKAEIRDLTARRDIHSIIINYMRGQDRLLPDVHLSSFHADTRVDCGLFEGDAAEFVNFAQGFLGDLQSSHHMLGQMDIQIDGNSATGEVYFLAQHRIQQDQQPYDLFVAGRYIDSYQDRGDGWKIASRKELIDWVRSDPASDSFLLENPTLNIGQRGKNG